MERVDRWLRISSIQDVQERRNAIILYAVLMGSIGFLVIILIAHVSKGMMEQASLVGIALAGAIGLLVLTWLGWRKLVSWLLPVLCFIIATQQVASSDRLLAEGLFAYPLLIAASALLLGRQGATIFTLLSLCAVLLVGIPQVNSGEKISILPDSLRLLTVSALMVSNGLVLYLAIDNLMRNLARLHQQERGYEQANRELRDLQATLEERVEERTRSLEATSLELETTNLGLETRAWLSTAQVTLNNAIRGDQKTEKLVKQTTATLCHLLEAQAGGLFLRENSEFRWRGGYITQPQGAERLRFGEGEGLAGEAARQNQRLLIDEVPAGYLPLVSGLGETNPRQILIQPITYNEIVIAVLELATLSEFTPRHLELLDLAAENIAIALRSAQTREQVETLLAETRQQAEELRTQEEELRAINEELQAHAESLNRKGRQDAR